MGKRYDVAKYMFDEGYPVSLTPYLFAKLFSKREGGLIPLDFMQSLQGVFHDMPEWRTRWKDRQKLIEDILWFYPCYDRATRADMVDWMKRLEIADPDYDFHRLEYIDAVRSERGRALFSRFKQWFECRNWHENFMDEGIVTGKQIGRAHV